MRHTVKKKWGVILKSIYYVRPTDGAIILKTPAFPVFQGERVVLYCQCLTANHSKITFFKDGAEITTNTTSSSGRVIKLIIKNVTQEDEGLYKCVSQDRKMESPESWMSVKPHRGQLMLFYDNIHYSDSCLHISQYGSMENVICYVFLGNFTSTNGTAASTSGKIILQFLFTVTGQNQHRSKVKDGYAD